MFGYKCFILNIKDNLGNFKSKANEEIFLGYSTSSKAYRVFNKRTLVVEESIHIVFDESNSFDPKKDFHSVDDIIDEFMDATILEETASKPLELEDPTKENDEEMPQPTLKDYLSKE